MAFDITKYLEENKIELGSIKKEIGTTISKSGHNDLRKTTYDVEIKDGKFDLSTHKSIMTESKQSVNESVGDIVTIADIFTRFLIGDREAAIKQLKGQMKNSFGTMENPGTKEYNDQFKNLVRGIAQSIKSNT